MSVRFCHAGATHSVDFGSFWEALPAGESYRDTSELELQGIVREIGGGAAWREIVQAHYAERNPWLYRIITDPSRDEFLRKVPPAAGGLFLDVGAGWGQYTLPLARRGRVVAVEPTPERCRFIEAMCRQELVTESLALVQADFLDLDFGPVFDQAFCIGVLEWVPRFRVGDPWALQLDFLRRLHCSLRAGGSLVVAIENRMGLKYLLGARDDHIAMPSIAVFDSSLASTRFQAATGRELRSFTYNLAEYKDLFAQAGFAIEQTHAAFPDYKIPSRIMALDDLYEAQVLASSHVLEHDGCDGSLLPKEFQEALASHYRSLSHMGVSSCFAPSYFFTLTKVKPFQL